MESDAAFVAWAERLVHDLVALSDLRARELRVVEWIGEMDPAYAAQVIAAVAALAQGKHAAAEVALLAFVNVRRYEKELGYQRLADLYRQADELDLPEVKELLLEGRAQRRVDEGGGTGNDHVEKTLGERKALAMTRDRDLLDRLLFDRHPQVIRILLTNPRLTERDVVRLAAMRPVGTAVLEEIVRQPKWLVRYRVKLALVSNPYTPTNLALSLVGYLNKPDLRQVADNSTLAEAVRARAKDLASHLPAGRRVRSPRSH
jgi:hypothetical protein